jgi:UDP-N-acetylmuramate dehydrogenase
VRNLAQHDLGGIEFLGNIPGSVGGAVVGNAGCYGRAVADVLVGAKLYDLAAREVVDVNPGYLAFAYRHSRLKDDPDKVVLDATLQLDPRPRESILGDLAEELEQRRQKHPHDAQCAGSFFKNPPGGKPAWQLITDAGMSTARVGRAALSPQHANFLVNEGGATSAQIIELEQSIRRAVYERCGVSLVPEVRYVSPTGVQVR